MHPCQNTCTGALQNHRIYEHEECCALGKQKTSHLLGVELKIPAEGELGSMLDSCAELVGVAPP